MQINWFCVTILGIMLLGTIGTIFTKKSDSISVAGQLSFLIGIGYFLLKAFG